MRKDDRDCLLVKRYERRKERERGSEEDRMRALRQHRVREQEENITIGNEWERANFC